MSLKIKIKIKYIFFKVIFDYILEKFQFYQDNNTKYHRTNIEAYYF